MDAVVPVLAGILFLLYVTARVLDRKAAGRSGKARTLSVSGSRGAAGYPAQAGHGACTADDPWPPTRANHTALFWAVFAIVHVVVDYTWLYSRLGVVGQAASTHMLDDSRLAVLRAAVVLFLAALVVGECGNVAMLLRIVPALSEASMQHVTILRARTGSSSVAALRQLQPLSHWRRVHGSAFWTVALVSALKLTAFPVLYCRVGGWAWTSAPVWPDPVQAHDRASRVSVTAPTSRAAGAAGADADAGQVDRRGAVMAFVEDVPQLAAVAVVAALIGGWGSAETAAALGVNAVAVLHGLAVWICAPAGTRAVEGVMRPAPVAGGPQGSSASRLLDDAGDVDGVPA